MTIEIHDKLIKLLAEVDELKQKKATLQADKTRHLDLIHQSEEAVRLCDEEITKVNESQSRLKGEMNELRDELFGRSQEAAPPVSVDDDTDPQDRDTEARKAWRNYAKVVKGGAA
jgi:hypothetical protein